VRQQVDSDAFSFFSIVCDKHSANGDNRIANMTGDKSCEYRRASTTYIHKWKFTLRVCMLYRQMKAKEFRWPFLAAVLALVVMREPENLGVSYGWTNGHYSFGGGTAPWSLAFAFVVTGLYAALMFSSPAVDGQPLPGVFRRFVAFWLDFVLAIMTVGPIIGVLPMLTEWRRTGVFQWDFERTTHSAGDGLVAAIALLPSFAALILYYALPVARRKPSPGSCIVGYRILPEEGRTIDLRKAMMRTLLGFVAVCAAWLAPFVERDRKKGQFWLDKVFHTRAVKLS
jgi:uncharacterized RDD family membrane protein YckC